MRTFVVTPPDPVVDWSRAAEHIESFDDEKQAQVEAMIAAATGHIDGPTGWLGRSIGLQTLEARFDLTCLGNDLRLPYGPVVELVSVKFLNSAGVEQTADLTQFELLGDELVPVLGWPWRDGSTRREAGRVRYRAGYAQVPAPIRSAILLMVGDLYRFRETASDQSVAPTAIPMSTTVENLLAPFRAWL